MMDFIKKMKEEKEEKKVVKAKGNLGCQPLKGQNGHKNW